MPIKGVSELVRLPRLGKIRLGIKKESDRGTVYPSPTDHFICPEEVKRVYGEKPKELKVMFPTEDESQWAQQWLKCYSASRGLICRGDGETAIARVDTATGEIATRESADTELREITCNHGNCPYYLRQQCRRVMNLQFLIPECQGFGVYQLNTSSFFSILNVNSGIRFVRSVCGRIAMIPCSLKLEPQEVTPAGKRKTVHVLTLTAAYSLVEIQRYARRPPGEALLLPAPDAEALEDLYPQEVLKQGEEEPMDDIPCIDGELLQAWDIARGRVRDLGLKETQLSKWFRDCYRIEVSLADFEQAFPAEKFSNEMLSRLGDSLTAYKQRQRPYKTPP